jgi:DNA (cytosine-5)-methyltransferase 1
VDIYSLMYEKLKLKPPIKMFEAFAGIGTQQMALKRLGVPYEIVGFSEIDKYAIQSYHAIHGDDIKNYGDITKMEVIPECDIFTWSFPCTDLSKAGQRKGMSSGTRSGLVYDVLRLLSETKHLPKVLIMENVPDLIQQKFHRQFGEIQLELENMGYMNYVETLNAKHYGVAQNRDRVFMVSIMGDYSYLFPKKVNLTKRLKDYLEKEVDEKFYLDEKTIERIGNWKSYQQPLDRVLTPETVAHTITTRVAESDAGGMNASMLLVNEPLTNYSPKAREYEVNGWRDVSYPLFARDYKDPKVIMIPEDTKQGYALAEDGDGIYINRPEQKRGVVQKGMIQTIKTSADDVGVVVNSRIRKLTPREAWRLMGIDDKDFDKAQEVCSNSQLYKQAGNAIVVDVFEAILREMIEVK